MFADETRFGRERALNAAYMSAEEQHRVGPLIKLCRESEAESPEDFQAWYLEHVHDEEYLQQLVDDMTRQTAYSPEMCKNYLYRKIFVRVWHGLHAQTWMRDLLRAHGISAKIAPDDWDAKYGVDIIAGANGELYCGIQCKSDTQRSIEDPRLEEQMKLWREKTKTPIFIIHYHEDFQGRRSISSDSERDIIKLIQLVYTERQRAAEETAERLFVNLDETT